MKLQHNKVFRTKTAKYKLKAIDHYELKQLNKIVFFKFDYKSFSTVVCCVQEVIDFIFETMNTSPVYALHCWPQSTEHLRRKKSSILVLKQVCKRVCMFCEYSAGQFVHARLWIRECTCKVQSAYNVSNSLCRSPWIVVLALGTESKLLTLYYSISSRFISI